MRAAVLNRPGDLALIEKDVPSPGPGEVLLKVEANTLCGTDYRLFTGAKTAGVRPGVVPGHEFAGRIVALGDGVHGLEVGRQATSSIVVACGACFNCQNDREHLCADLELFGYGIDGGLAEYLVVPARAVARGNVMMTNTEIDPRLLCLAEPVSCCLHGLDAYGVNPGETIVILGAGPIGLIHTQLAVAAGAGQVIVTNRSAHRREVAASLGAIGVDPTTTDVVQFVQERTDGRGADAVVVCIGDVELGQTALELARDGGRVNYFAGFPKGSTSIMEPNLIHYKELTVSGGSNAPRRDVARALRLLEAGVIDVNAIVSHTFALDDVHAAYDALRDRIGIKIAVVP